LCFSFKTDAAPNPWTEDTCGGNAVSDELLEGLFGCALRARAYANVSGSGEMRSSLTLADDDGHETYVPQYECLTTNIRNLWVAPLQRLEHTLLSLVRVCNSPGNRFPGIRNAEEQDARVRRKNGVRERDDSDPHVVCIKAGFPLHEGVFRTG
jgi:hypothetical protein